MRRSAVVATSLAIVSALASAGAARAEPNQRISGPVVHENLAIYFIHGPSASGAVPLTLDEALKAKRAQVRETGSVNSLQIENLGDTPIFVQAGDIVKGGKQDRTLAVSLLLPPKSGPIPIASFCVEAHRWSPRGGEDAHAFSASPAALPSRELKLAVQAPVPVTAGSASPLATVEVASAEVGTRQQRVWDNVAKAQARLTTGAGTDVRAKISESSLQLALENEKLGKLRDAYVAALTKAGQGADDIVGYVFAVNGKLNSGDVYMSNALFKKMWPKMLNASATEAIANRGGDKTALPTPAAVMGFLATANEAKPSAQPTAFGMQRVTRASDQAYLIEADLKEGAYLHRSYLAR
jgi:hypothetical protein